jgi:quercetin dioxygenase-like cupin family protein
MLVGEDPRCPSTVSTPCPSVRCSRASTPGAAFPEHQHPHEQTVVVLEGELELRVGGDTVRLTPGSVYVIPGDTPHAGTALVDSRVLDIFSPVRDDLRS